MEMLNFLGNLISEDSRFETTVPVRLPKLGVAHESITRFI